MCSAYCLALNERRSRICYFLSGGNFMQLLLGDQSGPPAKKRPYSSVWFVSELMHIIAACEERLPLVQLGEEVYSTVV